MPLKEILLSSNSEEVKHLLLDLGKTGELIQMSKPARLYPKPEPMNPNPKLIWIGSILFAIAIGGIGIATSTGGL